MSQIALATIPRQTVADPYVTRFVNEVTDLLKLEILQSLGNAKDPAAVPVKHTKIKVGGKVQKEYFTAGMAFTKHLNSKPVVLKKKVLEHSVNPAIFTPQLNTLRTGLNIDFKISKAVHQQINLVSKFSFFNEIYANRIIRVITDALDDVSGAGNGNSTIVHNKGLKFRLHEVKCVDETDPEFFGSDKIALGGASVDDEETVKKISQFTVGNFDDGDKKKYDPLKVLASFDLSNGTYPKTFGVFVSLAEKDNGGFGDFLNELYDSIKAEVVLVLAALGAAAGPLIGAAIGGSVGTAIGGPIGTIIGVLAGLILGALVAWIASLLQDDIFEPQVATVTLPDAAAKFTGNSLVSPLLSFNFEDFGGKYRVKYSWELRQ